MYKARSFAKPGRWDRSENNRNRFENRFANQNNSEFRGYGDSEDDPESSGLRQGMFQTL